MATSLQARVTVYTGTISDTSGLTDLLNAGIKSIINAIPEAKLEKYSSANTDSGSGVDVSSMRVVRAHKNGYRARRVDAGIKSQVAPSGIVGEVSVIAGGTGYSVNDVLTLVGGTGGTCTVTTVNSGVVTAVALTTQGSGYSQGVKSTTVAPPGGSNCLIYAYLSPTSIHQATTTDPVYYIENTKAYVIPSGGSIVGVSYPSNITYNSTSITNFPSEWEQAVVLFTVIQELLSKSNTIFDSVTALTFEAGTVPTVPSSPSFSFASTIYNDASYSLATFTPANIDITSSVLIDPIPTPPTYTMVTTPFDISNASTYIGTEEDGAKANAEVGKQSALLQKYGADQSNNMNSFNSLMTNQQLAVQRLMQQAQLDQQRLIDQSRKVIELNQFNAKIAIDTALQENQQAMALSIQNQAKRLESDIINRTEATKTQIAQYQATLQSYAEQVAKYGHDVTQGAQKLSNLTQKGLGQIQAIMTTIEQVRKELQTIWSLI